MNSSKIFKMYVHDNQYKKWDTILIGGSGNLALIVKIDGQELTCRNFNQSRYKLINRLSMLFLKLKYGK
jgi:hypothetical protein